MSGCCSQPGAPAGANGHERTRGVPARPGTEQPTHRSRTLTAAGWHIAGGVILPSCTFEMWRRWGLPLVPALEAGPSKGAAPRLVHQPGGRRFSVDLDLLGAVGEGGEDVAVLPGALGRGGADVALRPGVVREVKGAWREPLAGLVAGAGGQLGDVG